MLQQQNPISLPKKLLNIVRCICSENLKREISSSRCSQHPIFVNGTRHKTKNLKGTFDVASKCSFPLTIMGDTHSSHHLSSIHFFFSAFFLSELMHQQMRLTFSLLPFSCFHSANFCLCLWYSGKTPKIQVQAFIHQAV